MCRKEYLEVEAAFECLRSCIARFLNSNLVEPRSVRGVKSFRCRICCRDYRKRVEAKLCSDDCKKALIKKADSDEELASLDVQIPLKKFKVRPRPKKVKMGKPIRAKKPDPIPETPAAPEGDPSQHDAVKPPAAAAGAAEAPADAKKDKSKYQKKFHRDGAKYVCEYCSEKYFTKNEATACFDKH